MADYIHSALKGEQIHESRIKVLPAGSSMPVPEWEGQFVAIDTDLYYSVKKNNTLTWIRPTASNQPQLPSNVVTIQSGIRAPLPRTGSGVIYVDDFLKDVYYLNSGAWIKLGTSSGSSNNFDIIPSRADRPGNGNFFTLIDPAPETGQDNCLLIKKWQPNKKYYLAIKTPTSLSLGGADDNNFYLELWNGYDRRIISTHAQSTQSLAFLDSALFPTSTNSFRMGMYLLKNGQKRYLNFVFEMDTRLVDTKGLATVSYGE